MIVPQSGQRMYLEHFGLNDAPFSIAPNPRYLFLSERHREALAHLVYGVQGDDGFVLLTGEVGTGKTTVCRCLLAQLPENVDVAFIINPKLTAKQLLAAICDDLRITYPLRSSGKQLVDRINTYLLESLSAGRRTILIIDEAQNLSPDVLEQLRLLTNLETDERKLLQIMLLGQPELLETLGRSEMRQLNQRITARFHLQPLAAKEVSGYLSFRLDTAGMKRPCFNARAVSRIARLSGGIPRIINLIADRALLGAFAEGRHTVSTAIVNRAAVEVLGESRTNPMIRPAAISAAALILLLTVTWLTRPLMEPLPGLPNSQGENHAPAENLYASYSRGLTMAGHQDRNDAFKDLFALWGYYLPEENDDPCAAIAAVGLACLTARGTVADVIELDRPLITKLGPAGNWYTVIAADNRRVKLIASNRETDMPRDGFEDLFSGDYTLLWRMPPGYDTPASLGDSGADVDWLVTQLSLLDKAPLTRTTGHVYDNHLEQRVRDFQSSVNLPSDGVADERFWILFNGVQGQSPSLSDSDRPTPDA